MQTLYVNLTTLIRTAPSPQPRRSRELTSFPPDAACRQGAKSISGVVSRKISMDSRLRRSHSCTDIVGLETFSTCCWAISGLALPSAEGEAAGFAAGCTAGCAAAGAASGRGLGREHCHNIMAATNIPATATLVPSPLCRRRCVRSRPPRAAPTGSHTGSIAAPVNSGNQRRTSSPSTSCRRGSRCALRRAASVNSPLLTTIAPVAPCVHMTPISSWPTLWVT